MVASNTCPKPRHAGAQVYQLPLRWIGRFAALLDELEGQCGLLGITHYGMSMPTLEEVFLKCTAECAEQDLRAGAADAAGQLPPPPDGLCTVEMMPPKQASSAGKHAALPPAEVKAEGDSQEESRDPHEEGDEPGASSAPGSSNGGGNGSEASAAAEAAVQPGSLSRDDSAEALNDVPLHDGVPSSPAQRKSPAAPPGAASGRDGGRGTGGGNAARAASEQEPDLEDVPLDDNMPRSGKRPPRRRRPRWAVALRQMLRKRAIIAGDAVSRTLNHKS